MSQEVIALRPGVDVISTPLLNEMGFSDCNLIRFFQGPQDKAPFLQKLGGWSRLCNDTIRGSARGMHPWVDLSSIGYVAIGSDQALQVYTAADGHLHDVTPLDHTATPTQAFSVHAGSAVVTINDPNNNVGALYWITIANAIYVGGVVLQGPYQVLANPAPNGALYAITAGAPATATELNGGEAYSFTTTKTSAQVQVTQGARVFVDQESITVYEQTAVGGLAIQGTYVVSVAAGVATITPGGVATANQTVAEAAGAAIIQYEIAPGIDGAVNYGFGAGPFGAGLFGQGQGGAPAPPRQWSLDNFGQILVAAPLNGPLYSWTPPVSQGNVAAAVAGAPQFSSAIFVAMPQEQVVSLGSDAGSYQDPLLIRFSDVGNFVGAAAWTASATNQAGSFRLTEGARCVGGMQGPQQAYIWTDIGLWAMNYLGFPLVYGFNKIAEGCGLLAPRAAALVNSRLIWAGAKGFWEYDGEGVAAVPCSVWDFMYGQGQLDLAWTENVFAAPNSDFTEIFFFFPTVGSNGVPNAFVKLNLSTNVWDKGTLTGMAAIDASAVGRPMRVDGVNGLIQQHETSTDADGVAMNSWALSGMFKFKNGEQFSSLDRLFPDFTLNAGGKVLITVYVQRYPNDQRPRAFGPFTATDASIFVITRCRGRVFRLKLDFSSFGTFARMGAPIARLGGSGKR